MNRSEATGEQHSVSFPLNGALDGLWDNQRSL